MAEQSFHHVRLAGYEALQDVLVDHGIIVRIAPNLPPGDNAYDAAGGLLTAPLVDPHIHLDAVMTGGQPDTNH
ncbi:MAG: cytosine deaminase, partial [Firmicutes bacterium]|nr:cytosine deaminase [Bacillota bacterium]